MSRLIVLSLALLFGISAQASTIFFDELEKIKSRSLVLETERERLTSAQKNLTSKNFFWTPALSLGIGRQKGNTDAGGATTYDYDYYKASAAWNLFKGGGDLYARSAAKSAEQAQQFKIEDENLLLEVRAASLIFHQLYLRDVIQSTQELVRLRDESHRIVQEKYKQGKSPLQEVMKSEVDRTQQQNRLRSLEIEQLENQAALKALLQDEIKTQAWPFSVEQKTPGINAKDPTSLSPGTKNLNLLSIASENVWKSTRAGHWPTLDLVAEYKEFPIKDRGHYEWTAGLVLTLPLWNQYDTSARSASAFAESLASRNQYEDALRAEKARQEVLQKRIELARLSLQEAKGNQGKSERLYQDMLKSFRYGRMSMNELLIEQNRLIQSALNLSQSQWDFHKVLMEGCAILGLSVKSCLR